MTSPDLRIGGLLWVMASVVASTAGCADVHNPSADASVDLPCFDVFCLVRDAGIDRIDAAPIDDDRSLDDRAVADVRADRTTDRPSPDDAQTCSRLGFSCATQESCQLGCADSLCFDWTSKESGSVVAGRHCALISGCSAGANELSCPVGMACVAARLSVGGLPQGFACLPTAACAELMDRYYGGVAMNLSSTQCWYSDGTRVRTGAAPDARCGVFGRRTCGLGCPCPEGDVCSWASEESPTGVCLHTRRALPLHAPETRCYATDRTWRCDSSIEACLLPVRGDADGILDTDRMGACVRNEECAQLAAAVPGRYRCLTRREGP